MNTGLLLTLNKVFPRHEHPFNTEQSGGESFAMWQYHRSETTIALYREKYSLDVMFRDKVVLDVGCAAAGKTMWYASQGVKHITGMDILERWRPEAEGLARQLGLDDKFTFVVADAAHTSFPANTFDTIIMNDAMEHVQDPAAVLKEICRILRPGGKLYVNFPPIGHPFGAHMADLIGIPWVHKFFREETLCDAYRKLCKDLPDGEERVSLRISKDPDGKDYISYINHMTIARFKKIRENCGLRVDYYREVPLRSYLAPLAKFPPTREYFVGMVVCVLEKES